MAKKRNHYIPQFLLRRFANDEGGSRIWQFRENAKPVAIGTRDAAVSRYFYGDPSLEIEDDLQALESGQATLLEEVAGGADLESRCGLLTELVWSLATRTQAFRGHFAEVTQRLLTGLQQVSPETMATAFTRGIENELETHIDDLLRDSGIPEEEIPAIRAHLINRLGGPEAARKEALRHMDDVLPVAPRLLSSLEAVAPQASMDGHIKLMAKQMAVRGKPPSGFEVSKWHVQTFDSNTIVLGDGVVVATSSGEFGALAKFASAFERVFVPISHRSVLVGDRTSDGLRDVDPEALNRASVSLSLNGFFGSRNTAAELALLEHLGSGDPMLSDDVIQEILEECWSSLNLPAPE